VLWVVRYRDLKKQEENKASRKHALTLKKHTAALRREAGVDTACSVASASAALEPEEEPEEQVESFCHYPSDTAIVDNLVYSKVQALVFPCIFIPLSTVLSVLCLLLFGYSTAPT
jgi:hypothetical protein